MHTNQAAAVVAADLIRCVRIFHALDQEAFGKCFQVSRRTVIRWEKGGNSFIDDEKEFRSQLWVWMLDRYYAATKTGVT